MKGITLIFLCAVALAISDEEVEVYANGCPVDPTILKVVAHERFCNLFYSCLGEYQIEQRCPVELVFNEEKQICDWAQNVECGNKEIFEYVPEVDDEDDEEISIGGNGDPSLAPQICANEGSDGVLIAHENCNDFYKCDKTVPITFHCPENLMYNFHTGICDWPYNVECGDRVIREPLKDAEEDAEKIVEIGPIPVTEACASDIANELILPHENCNLFYKCWLGTPHTFRCPSGLMFNIEEKQCDWPFNVYCGDRPIAEENEEQEEDEKKDEDDSADEDSHVYDDPSQAPAICATESSDNILIAHENCYQFYKCWSGAPIAMDCPINLLYSPKLQICDWPLSVDCGNRNTRVMLKST